MIMKKAWLSQSVGAQGSEQHALVILNPHCAFTIPCSGFIDTKSSMIASFPTMRPLFNMLSQSLTTPSC